VLPFGLSTACTLSTKLARLAYKKIWRSEGKQVIMLLDDGLGIEEDDINNRNVIQPLTVHENPRNSVSGS
jgi:hypothetical protein